MHPPDLEQRIHPVRRLDHFHVQIRVLDRQQHGPQVPGIVIHHDHQLRAVAVLELRGHRHLVGAQKRGQVVRLDPAPARGRLVPLEQTLVDPVRDRRGRDLTHPRDPLRTPIPLGSR